MTEGKHELVARIDPENTRMDLHVVTSGILAQWWEPQFKSYYRSTLYAPDKHIIAQIELSDLCFYVVHDVDGDYYVCMKGLGEIDELVNVVTGEKKAYEGGYYPAVQSVANSEHSMHIFRVWGRPITYYVYGADYKTFITRLEAASETNFALAPDGQTAAYLQFTDSNQAPIRILDMNGKTRRLSFKAEQILWGPVEYVPFYAPG